jgi:APA family basic amino acid/polyamine antiporter
LIVIGVGAFYVDPANWSPFIADVSSYAVHKSAVSRIVSGGAVMFFCFIGYDTVSTLSADAINPARDIPIAAFLTIGTAATLYSAVGLILTGMIPWKDIAAKAPLAEAFNTLNLSWAKYIVNGFSLINIAITVFACLMGQPKIFAAIARDGLLPRSLAKENEKGVASGALMLAIWGTALITGFYDVQAGLIDMISAGCLFSMAAVCAGMLAARYNHAPAEMRARGNGAVIAFFLAALAWCLIFVNGCGWIWSALSGIACLIPFSMLLWHFYQYPDALKPASSIENAFVCPLMPWLPCIAVLANFYVLASIDWYSLQLFAGWAVIGVAVYLCYGVHHSRLGVEMESVKEFGKF